MIIVLSPTGHQSRAPGPCESCPPLRPKRPVVEPALPRNGVIGSCAPKSAALMLRIDFTSERLLSCLVLGGVPYRPRLGSTRQAVRHSCGFTCCGGGTAWPRNLGRPVLRPLRREALL